jgi:hypothetical protein
VVLKELLNTCTVAKDEAYAYWIQEALVDAHVLEETVKFAFEGTDKERTRACWILHHVGDRKPELLLGFVGRMMDQLDHAKTDAEVRFILRYFSKYELPQGEKAQGRLLDYSWKCMMDMQPAVAPRVYGMTIAYRMVRAYPELAPELAQTLETIIEYGSAGMKNRGDKILKWLRKDGLL